MTTNTVQFRPLQVNEMNLVAKLDAMGDLPAIAGKAADWNDILVAYRYQEHRQGVDYTVAVVALGDGRLLVGCTKRNPTDPRNRIRGRIEALRRALCSGDVAFEIPAAAVRPTALKREAAA